MVGFLPSDVGLTAENPESSTLMASGFLSQEVAHFHISVSLIVNIQLIYTEMYV
jgi:hypothetical protein